MGHRIQILLRIMSAYSPICSLAFAFLFVGRPRYWSGAKLYGGRPLKWWKEELGNLRRQLELVRGSVVEQGVEILHRRDEVAALEHAFVQLQNDARRARVPKRVRKQPKF